MSSLPVRAVDEVVPRHQEIEAYGRRGCSIQYSPNLDNGWR